MQREEYRPSVSDSLVHSWKSVGRTEPSRVFSRESIDRTESSQMYSRKSPGRTQSCRVHSRKSTGRMVPIQVDSKKLVCRTESSRTADDEDCEGKWRSDERMRSGVGSELRGDELAIEPLTKMGWEVRRTARGQDCKRSVATKERDAHVELRKWKELKPDIETQARDSPYTTLISRVHISEPYYIPCSKSYLMI